MTPAEAPTAAVRHPRPSLARRLALPAREILAGLEGVLGTEKRGGGLRLATVFAGLIAGWFLYVPVHELLHAAGCRLAGGAVSRLEIAPMYGGALLARVLPFVVSGGEYAGRLSGFDTRGSDWIYLATDLGPFVLTLFPGVWLWRMAARRRRCFAFGFVLPLAMAPFLSLPGDAYEIGSLLVTHLPTWQGVEVLRGDDVFLRAEAVGTQHSARLWAGLIAAQLSGLAWCLLMYALGGLIARRLGQPPLTTATSPEESP